MVGRFSNNPNLPIPREVAVDNLRPDEIQQITQTVFVATDSQPAELLFVFGTSSFDRDIVALLANDCRKGLFQRILVTGLSGRRYHETGKTLASIMRDEFLSRGVPSDIILVQDKSKNTLEDVAFSLNLLKNHNVAPRRIAFVCKAHHSGRCLRTLRKFFPLQTLLPMTYEAKYEGIRVSRENWYQHPISRGRVYGEYLRIITYASRGDIAEVRDVPRTDNPN